MEPRKKPKDPNDPREYLPVPHGGPILLGKTIIAAILTTLCIGIVIAGGFLHDRIDDSVIKFITKIIILVGMGGVVSVLALAYRWMWRDASEYWLRNVRGYRLRCFISRPYPQHVASSVFAPGKNAPDTAYGNEVVLVLPLGGWFRRPYIMVPTAHRSYRRLRGARVRIMHFTLQHQDGKTKALELSTVRLTDRHGNRMTVTVWHALELCERFGADLLSSPTKSLASAFGDERQRTEALQREHSGTQDQLRETSRLLDWALSAMEQAARNIAKTSRFGASVEALRIRLALLERFREVIPQQVPEGSRNAQRLVWVADELERTRADLARRERHKSKPTTSAGA